jgi:orotidine-5'-phosphate decarboxylase
VTSRERLVVALDVAAALEADALVAQLAGAVGPFKVGSQLFTAAGPAFVRGLVARGERVFLDLKYHDIPNTVARAVAEACALGVSLLTVHGLGGPKMLEAAVAARSGGTRLLAITVLTSHDEDSLERVGIRGPLGEQVARLARLAREAGVDGVVASPREVELVRAVCGRDLLVVTPGIRPLGAEARDQSRHATPAAALAAGSDYLVVGRPITEARDPRAAARAIAAEMERATLPL